jgi:hypothetical protein
MAPPIPVLNPPIQTSRYFFYFSWTVGAIIPPATEPAISFNIMIADIAVTSNIISVTSNNLYITLNGFAAGTYNVTVSANSAGSGTSGPSNVQSFTVTLPCYDIITCPTMDGLITIINQKMLNGWLPSGGASYIINSTPSYNNNNKYMQTIYQV